MAIDVGVGYIPILPDMAGFEEKVAAGAEKAGKSTRLRSAGKTVGAGLLAGVTAVTAIGVERLLSSEKIDAQIKAREKSTKEAANVTGQHIDKLANKLLNLSGVDNEATKSSAALLLSFRSIKDEAGKGNKVFDQTEKAILNVATAMNQGAIPSAEQLKAVTIQVGKAVNDPIKGLSALRRVGVSFTEQQEEQVKTLVESGKSMQAQKIVLGELNKEFAGSAKAAGQTLPGQLDKAKAKFQNLAASLVKDLLPAFDSVLQVADETITFLDKHKDFAKGLLIGIGALGAALLVITGGPITLTVAGITALVAGFVEAYKHSETFRDVVKTVGAALTSAFHASLPWIENALHNVGTALQDAGHWISVAFKNTKTTIGGVVKSLEDFWHQSVIVRTAVKVIETELKVLAGVIKTVLIAEFDFLLSTAKRVLPAVEEMFHGFAQVIKGIVQVVSGILTLNFGRALTGIKNIFSGGIKVVLGYLRGMTAPARQIVSDVGSALKSGFETVWDGIESVFEAGVGKITGWIQDIANVINPLLSAIGVGEVHLTSTTSSTPAKHKTALHHQHRAQGGPVRVPGAGLQDTVPLAVNGTVSAVVGPGEDLLVANRHQRPLLDAAVSAAYGVNGLDGFYGKFNRPHYAAEGGVLPHLPHHSIGSFVESVAGTGLEIADAPIRIPAEAIYDTAKNAAQFVTGLPSPPKLPGVLGEIASGVLGKVKDWIGGLPASVFGGGSSLSGGKVASPAKFAEYMLQAGFPAEASVIAEGLGTIKSESDYAVNNGQGPSGHIGPWAESPTFGSAKTREDPLGSTRAAYKVGWRPTHSFWDAWGQWEAGQSGLHGGGAGTYGPEYMGIARRAVRSHGKARGGIMQARSLGDLRDILPDKEVDPRELGLLRRLGVPGFAGGGKISAMLGRMKELKGTPYVWGGGHGGFSSNPSGLDCSGAVSDVLHAAGLLSTPEDSTGLESFGSAGYGKNMTVFANSGHAFMELLGHYWGTWVEGGAKNLQFQPTPPANFRHEYQARHSAAVDGESFGGSGSSSGSSSTTSIPNQAGFHSHKGRTGKGGGTEAPGAGKVPTAKLSFGSLPGTLHGVRKELGERRSELAQYKLAYGQAKNKEVKAALKVNVNLLSHRIHALLSEQARLLKAKATKRFESKVNAQIAKQVGFSGIKTDLTERENAYNKQDEYAQQLVSLEPEFASTEYLKSETGAYGAELGLETNWRNALIRDQGVVAGKTASLATELQKIEALKGVNAKAYRKQRFRIPLLRKAISTAQGFGSTLNEDLANVQGAFGPSGFLSELSPTPEAGKFGGLIFTTQDTLRELGLKGGGTSATEGERNSLIEEQLSKSRVENAVLRSELPVLKEFGASRAQVPFGGVFHSGGVVPGRPGQEVAAILEAGETVTPVGEEYDHHVTVGVKEGPFADLLEVSVDKKLRDEASKSRRTFR